MAGTFRYTLGGDYRASDSATVISALSTPIAHTLTPGPTLRIGVLGSPDEFLFRLTFPSQTNSYFPYRFDPSAGLVPLRTSEVGVYFDYAHGGGAAFMDGGTFGDVLIGGALSDTLRGLGGDDVLIGGAGDDLLNGGAGDADRVNYAAETGTGDIVVNLSTSFVILGPGLARDSFGNTDSLSGVESVATGAGDDRLYGGGAAETFRAGAGEDILSGGGGNDRLDGGDGADAMTGGFGDDTFYIDDAFDAVTELSGGGTDTVVTRVSGQVLGNNIERLMLAGAALIGTGNDDANTIVGNVYGNRLSGAGGDDRLDGRGGGDDLFGGADDDRLIGGAGEDILTGGQGSDVLNGGADSDWFVFRSADEGADRIADFEAGIDLIVLDIAVFGGARLPPGGIADIFAESPTGRAAAPDDLVLYNTRNGALWFDSDGNGAAAAIPLVRLSGAPDLTASDILIDM